METDLRIPLTSEQQQLLLEATREEPDGMAAWARALLLEAARAQLARKARSAESQEHGSPPADLEKRFRQLVKQWKRDTDHLSVIGRMVKHSAYQEIIR